ncbi:DMT family transporter [Solicola gregarius]|uniref:DMT family transporter n=1 Tax=Solicola gregarius TaxID=2908642 RepID=A0AA46YJW8_9ACTN|nr:DMT family transporter [Solicola gregarius]UYM05040.1 DMT family transporter [Solicola gregarius]
MAQILLVVMWSSGFIGAELGTRYASADTLLAWRYLAASVVVVLLVRLTRTRVGGPGTPRQALVGLLSQVGYLGGTVTGVGLGVAPGTSALIASLQPLVVASVAGRLLGEHTSAKQRLGLAVGIAGVTLVVANDLGNGDAPAYAYLLVLGGMLALSAGTILERRWRPSRTLLESLAVQTVVSAVAFFTVAGALGHAAPPATAGFWWSVVWVVALSTFGGYGAYTYVVRHRGATTASTLLYLTPPTTMLWAYVMFGDPLTVLGIGGLAVCAVGVALALRRPTADSAVPQR